MPIALLAALAGSLAIHAAALLGMDVELFGGGPEPDPAPLRAEIRPPPEPPASPPPDAAPAPVKPVRQAGKGAKTGDCRANAADRAGCARNRTCPGN